MITPITIDHSNYDKISDDIYVLGNNIVLKFNVSLSSKVSSTGERYPYHHEYLYETNKYISDKYLATIKRSFDFYLSFENMKQIDGSKEFIRISVQNILNVKAKFNQATEWFTSNKYDGLFVQTKDKLTISKDEQIVIRGLPMDKYIIIEPTIITLQEGLSTPGVRVLLSSKTNYVDLSVDKFMGLVYMIDTINFYQSALSMVNYLQRPPYGTNMYSTVGDTDVRTPSKESFFDTVANKNKR